MGKSTTLYAGLVRNDSVDIATCTAARCSQGHTPGESSATSLQRVRRLGHFPPQRHLGGSPFAQQTATSRRESSEAQATNTPGWAGRKIAAAIASRTKKATNTAQPCQTVGTPQPQP